MSAPFKKLAFDQGDIANLNMEETMMAKLKVWLWQCFTRPSIQFVFIRPNRYQMEVAKH